MPKPASWQASASGWFADWFEIHANGVLGFSDKAAANLASGFLCFLVGRFTGTAILKNMSAHTLLGLYGVINAVLRLVILFELGWVAVVSVFLNPFSCPSCFRPSLPWVFLALVSEQRRRLPLSSGNHGGAILPKLMGHVADTYDRSRAFIVPLLCFAFGQQAMRAVRPPEDTESKMRFAAVRAAENLGLRSKSLASLGPQLVDTILCFFALFCSNAVQLGGLAWVDVVRSLAQIAGE